MYSSSVSYSNTSLLVLNSIERASVPCFGPGASYRKGQDLLDRDQRAFRRPPTPQYGSESNEIALDPIRSTRASSSIPKQERPGRGGISTF